MLNERIYRRGAETHQLPLLSLFSASNHLPEDDALRAMFDRFLLRCHVQSLKREAMPRLLAAGWALERSAAPSSSLSAAALTALSALLPEVELTDVMDPYMDVIFKVRDLGIAFSDRRAVKVLRLLAASALLCGRKAANPSDLWVLRYVWDREEQIEPLAALINGVLEQHASQPARHLLAAAQPQPDGEDLARQLDGMDQEINKGQLSLTAIARLKDRLTELGDRAAWLADTQHRTHLLDRVRKALDLLG